MRKSQSFKILALTAFLCCLLAASSFAVTPGRYTATALIRVLPYYSQDPTIIQTPVFDTEIQKGFRNSRAALMLEESFLVDLLSKDKVRDTSWFKDLAADGNTVTPQLYDDLENNFQVTTSDDTDFIVVSMSCPNPKDAAVIVNQAVALFISEQRDRGISNIRDKLVELEKRRVALQHELDLVQKAMDDVRSSTGFTDLEERNYPSPQEVRLNRLQQTKDELLLRLAKIGVIENVEQSVKDSTRAEIDQVEKMLAEAAAQMKKLDLARVQYKQQAQIRDQALFQLNQIKTLIEKYRIMAEDPDTAKVRLVAPAAVPIAPD